MNRLWHVNFMPQGLNPQLLKNLWNRAVVCIKSVVCLFFACTLPHEFLSFAFIFFLNLCLSSFASIVYAMTFWANYFFFLWTLSSLCARRTKQKESQEFAVIADFLKLYPCTVINTLFSPYMIHTSRLPNMCYWHTWAKDDLNVDGLCKKLRDDLFWFSQMHWQGQWVSQTDVPKSIHTRPESDKINSILIKRERF